MEFAQARDIEYPPYLLGFSGSPGERHVENLKVVTPQPFGYCIADTSTDLKRSWICRLQQSRLIIDWS